MTQSGTSPNCLARLAVADTSLTSTFAIKQGWGALFPVWRVRSRSRAALRRLTSEQLADVGISSAMAYREGAKWFWQA